MSSEIQVILKSLAPRVMAKAMQSFDRATTVVVVACWIAAVLMMGFAIYTVNLSLAVKKDMDAAMVAEPSLPTIVRAPVSAHSVQVMADRLTHRYPEINIAVHGDQLVLTANEGAKFHQWLTTLSYVDTIAPDYHWSIQNFCVGKCGGNDLMRAILKGEQISFKAPE